MMKRLISTLVLLTCVIALCAPALAISTEEEWNASCNWVIAYNTTLYNRTAKDDATTATDLYAFEPKGTIKAGSRVSILSSYENKRQIYYWNGGRQTAWVEDSAVRWSEAAGGNVGESTGKPSGGNGGSVSTGTNLPSSGGSANRRPAPVKSSGIWNAANVKWIQEDGSEIGVTLEYLGTAECTVFDGDEMVQVPTADLKWDTEAPEDQRLAVIYAPRTGKATLRAEANSKSRALAQCEAGKIVLVLRVGKTWTRVLYDGKEGLVLNSALTFFPVVEKDAYDHATLTYQGRTDTSATISVYTSSKASRKIKQWRVGSEVVTLEETGSWTEIELEGYHGFVKTEYLD